MFNRENGGKSTGKHSPSLYKDLARFGPPALSFLAALYCLKNSKIDAAGFALVGLVFSSYGIAEGIAERIDRGEKALPDWVPQSVSSLLWKEKPATRAVTLEDLGGEPRPTMVGK